MLKFGNKEFRNLEEQVQYLTSALESGKLIDELGIKVLGVYPTIADALATVPGPYYFGDAFEVGMTKPYQLYIYTRKDGSEQVGEWIDFGPFPAPGPQGELGPTPSISIKANVINTTGIPEATVIKTGTDKAPIFNFTFKNIKGERGREGMQGIQGKDGKTGPIGPRGLKGDKGDKGETGPAFHVQGTLASTSQLPTPTAEMQDKGYAYLIADDQGVKHTWVIQGPDSGPFSWIDIGTAGVGVKGDPGENGKDGIGLNTLTDVNLTLGDTTVQYDTTEGMQINSTGRFTYTDGNHDAMIDLAIPIKAGKGIVIDKSADSESVDIKVDNNVVTKDAKDQIILTKAGSTTNLDPGLINLSYESSTTGKY